MSSPTDPPGAPNPRAVAAAFGLGRVVGEPVMAARGEMGRIWRLETTTGRWALKEVFRPEPDAAEWALADVAFQEAALEAGVPMPRPLRARDGRPLIEVGPADQRRSVRVYAWVDLRGRDAAVPVHEVAAVLGRLHGLAIADAREIHPWYRESVPPDAWPGILADARVARAPWAGALERLLPALLAVHDVSIRVPAATEPAEPGLAEPEPAERGPAAPGPETPAARAPAPRAPTGPITCHLDYNPENVLLDTSGGLVVVDWENSGAAFAEQELASAVGEFVADPAETAPFLRTYAEGGGPARLRDRTSFAMTLTVQAALVRTYARRALDRSFGDEDRARAAFWIEDIAAHAFTMERIDRWLDAADRAGLLAG